jgi:hypothetical protein
MDVDSVQIMPLAMLYAIDIQAVFVHRNLNGQLQLNQPSLCDPLKQLATHPRMQTLSVGMKPSLTSGPLKTLGSFISFHMNVSIVEPMYLSGANWLAHHFLAAGLVKSTYDDDPGQHQPSKSLPSFVLIQKYYELYIRRIEYSQLQHFLDMQANCCMLAACYVVNLTLM